MIVVLSPYSGNEKHNFQEVLEYTGKLLRLGKKAFAPIIYGHFMKEIFGLKGDFDYWEYLTEIFKVADEFHILLLDNYENSVGLKKEINIIEELGKYSLIKYIRTYPIY
jgi:hypothetical protein